MYRSINKERKMTKTNFSKYQKVTMFALVGAILFNPMAVQILDEYFKTGYTVISIACTVWVLGYLLKKVLTPEKVNLPKKSKKSVVKSSEYLDS